MFSINIIKLKLIPDEKLNSLEKNNQKINISQDQKYTNKD